MVFCIDAPCRPNGIYQLPDAIFISWIVFLWNWLWYVWKITTLWNILCGGRYLVASNYLEPYLVTLLQVWSAWMVLEEFDLLEETTVCEIKFLRIKYRFLQNDKLQTALLLFAVYLCYPCRNYTELIYWTFFPSLPFAVQWMQGKFGAAISWVAY